MSENNQTRVARRQKKKTKKKQKPIWKKIFLIIGIVILAIGVAVGGIFTYYIATAPELDPLLLTDAYSSKYRSEERRVGKECTSQSWKNNQRKKKIGQYNINTTITVYKS